MLTSVDVDDLRHALGGVVLEAGAGWAHVEDQLREELGHEVRAEPGPLDDAS
jgi:hypothetical protein